jgi:uncharacterized protein (UPF0333 family)
MRAQIGLEYLVILGIVLFVLVPIAYVSYTGAGSSSRSAQAQLAVQAIASAADTAYAQGEGALAAVRFYMPEGVDDAKTYLGAQEANINIGTDIYAVSRGEMKGVLPSTAGLKTLSVRSYGSFVVIGDTTIVAFPGVFSLSLAPGASALLNANVSNIGAANAGGVTASESASWLSVSPQSIGTINAGANASIAINVSAASLAKGDYADAVNIYNATGANVARIAVKLRVA